MALPRCARPFWRMWLLPGPDGDPAADPLPQPGAAPKRSGTAREDRPHASFCPIENRHQIRARGLCVHCQTLPLRRHCLRCRRRRRRPATGPGRGVGAPRGEPPLDGGHAPPPLADLVSVLLRCCAGPAGRSRFVVPITLLVHFMEWRVPLYACLALPPAPASRCYTMFRNAVPFLIGGEYARCPERRAEHVVPDLSRPAGRSR